MCQIAKEKIKRGKRQVKRKSIDSLFLLYTPFGLFPIESLKEGHTIFHKGVRPVQNCIQGGSFPFFHLYTTFAYEDSLDRVYVSIKWMSTTISRRRTIRMRKILFCWFFFICLWYRCDTCVLLCHSGQCSVNVQWVVAYVSVRRQCDYVDLSSFWLRSVNWYGVAGSA